MIESRTWLLITLFILLLIGLLNLSTIEENAPPPLLGRALVEEFDYGMTGIVRTHYDKNGLISTQLSAEALYHYPQQQKIKLTHPVLQFTMADGNWRLSSNKGSLSETRKELNLQEQVELIETTRNHQVASKNIHMKMSELLFKLDDQVAFSPYPVELKTDGWLIKGVGLSIDVKKQQVTLLDKVYARHEKSQ